MNATTTASLKARRRLPAFAIALSMTMLSGCATLYFQQVQERYQDLVAEARACLGPGVLDRAFAAWDVAVAENERRREQNFERDPAQTERQEYLDAYQEAIDAALGAGLDPERESLLRQVVWTRSSYLDAERWDRATAAMGEIVDLSTRAEQASREAAAAVSAAAAAAAAAAGHDGAATRAGAEAAALLAGADPNVALAIGEAAPGLDLGPAVELVDQRGLSGDEAEAAVRAALSALDGEQDPDALVAMGALLARAEAAAVAAAREVPTVDEEAARAGAARAIREVIAIGNPDGPKYRLTPATTIEAGVQGALYAAGVSDDDRYGSAAFRIRGAVIATLRDAGVDLFSGDGIEPLAGLARLSLAAELAGTRAGANRSDARDAAPPAVQAVLAEAGAQLDRMKAAARDAMAGDYRSRAADTPLVVGMQQYVEVLDSTGDAEQARNWARSAVKSRLDAMAYRGATRQVDDDYLHAEARRITDEIVRRLGQDPAAAARAYDDVVYDIGERARLSVDEQQVLAYTRAAAARARQEASGGLAVDEPYLSGALATDAAARLQGARAAAERAAALWQEIDALDPHYLVRGASGAQSRWERVADKLTRACPARDPFGGGPCQRAPSDVVDFATVGGGIIGAADQRRDMLAEGYQVPLIPGFSLREDERETHRDAAAAIAIEAATVRATARAALTRSQGAAAELPGLAAAAQQISRERSEAADALMERTRALLGEACPDTAASARAVTAAEPGEGLPVRSPGEPLPEREPPGEIADDGARGDEDEDETRVSLLRVIPRAGADFFDYRNPLGSGGAGRVGGAGVSGTAGGAGAPAGGGGGGGGSGPCTGTVRSFSATSFVTSDPGGAEPAVINLLAANPATLEFCFEGGALRIAGPSPFIAVSGTDSGGSFSGLSGAGSIGGNAASAVASGSFDGAAVFFGYTITLPDLGASVVYNYGGLEIE